MSAKNTVFVISSGKKRISPLLTRRRTFRKIH